MKRLLLIALILCVFMGFVSVLGFIGGRRLLNEAYGAETINEVQIPRGASMTRIAHLLSEAGLLRDPLLLRAAHYLEPSDRQLQAGRYRFSEPASPFELLRRLRAGDTLRIKLTIPEGLDWRETVSLLVSEKLGSRLRFEELVTSPVLIQDLDPQADNLEGYLFPETYFLSIPLDEKSVVTTLVEQARRTWTPERQQRAHALGWTIRQAVTMASLVEKETAQPDERGLVSSVFHNRLQRNMKLACDPTVVYAVKRVKEYDGIIHQSDLDFDSPYNTYLYPGLPPGPIANPGIASIEAALNPASSSYLFFVSRNDGTHVFSRTYQEHSRAVQTYQR